MGWHLSPTAITGSFVLAMSCERLIQHLGFECRELSDAVISVATPFSFADGEAIGFYLEDRPNEIVVSDNGDTLFHLRGLGLDLSDRRRWRPFRQIAELHGFELQDSGEITGNTSKDSVSQLVAKYIAAMLDIVDLEREQLGMPEEIDQFIQEVEFHLHAWKPQAGLVHLPTIMGMSGRSHTFHFEFDGTLVDAARPHSNKTGAILRKAADLGLAGITTPILIIMDDREDQERVRVETEILSSMVSVLSFSQLMRNAGTSPGAH